MGVRHDEMSQSETLGEVHILQCGIMRVGLHFVTLHSPQIARVPSAPKSSNLTCRRDAQNVSRRPGSDLESTVTSEQNLGWFETAKLIVYHGPVSIFCVYRSLKSTIIPPTVTWV